MPLDKTTIIQNAQKFAVKGQIDKAIEEWQKLIKETPNDGNIYNTIGDLYLKKNNNSEAIASYLKAASAFDKAGFSLKTIAVYKKIVKIDPENFDIYIKLADLDADRGLAGNAIEEYLKVIRHYSKNGFNKDSIPIYKKIVNLDSSNIPMRLKLVDLCLKEGLKQDAVEQYIQIADVYKFQNKLFEGEEILRRALALQPNHSQLPTLLKDFKSAGVSQEVIPNAQPLKADSLSDSPGYQEFSLAPGSPVAENPKKAVPDSTGPGRPSASTVKTQENESVEPLQSTQNVPAGKTFGSQSEMLSNLLGEAEGYIKYHLLDKAEELLRKILEVAPDHPEALKYLNEIHPVGNQPAKASNPGENGMDLLQKDEDFLNSLESAENADELMTEENQQAPFEFQLDQEETPSIDEEKIREKLAEGEFYVQQGLLGEAKIIYETILQYFPENALAKVKLNKVLEDLNEMDDSANLPVQKGSPVAEADLAANEVSASLLEDIVPDSLQTPEPAPPPLQPGKVKLKTTILEKTEKTEFVNLMGELEEDFKEDSSALPEEEILDDDFSKIIKEFQRGIQQNIGEKDFETHFNLGIAYKEMGLRTEAIGEFQISSKGGSRMVDSAILLAQCYLEESLPNIAVEQLTQAIQLKQLNPDQIHSLKYELANFYELGENFEEAIKLLSDIYKENVNYRDVAKKISQIRQKTSRKA